MVKILLQMDWHANALGWHRSTKIAARQNFRYQLPFLHSADAEALQLGISFQVPQTPQLNLTRLAHVVVLTPGLVLRVNFIRLLYPCAGKQRQHLHRNRRPVVGMHFQSRT